MSLGAGRNRAFGLPSASPSQTGQSARSMMTGIRSWIGASRPFASVVMVAKVWSLSPSGDRHSSQMPPNATGSPSTRATANGIFPSGS